MRAQCSIALLLCQSLAAVQAAQPAAPLAMGETYTLQSKALDETRRINVYLPPGYAESADQRFAVLYMPDGGLAEDFLHIAGLVQVSVGNGTMRPFVLVGIENTQRRRDLTGPTQNEADKKIAPRVGGSATFRKFLRDELMPDVKARYRTTDEAAIVGESLAGFFVIETFLLEPDLFDSYIAIDPSLWWNSGSLVKSAPERLRAQTRSDKALWFASSIEQRGDWIERFASAVQANAPPGMQWRYEPMQQEKHSTIYHPAALKAFRTVFRP
jgi:predicted alpha/beta superfamily hydrolase